MILPCSAQGNIIGYTRKRDFVTFAGGQSDKIVACWDKRILVIFQKNAQIILCIELKFLKI